MHKPIVRFVGMDEYRRWFVYTHRSTSAFATWAEAIAFALRFYCMDCIS